MAQPIFEMVDEKFGLLTVLRMHPDRNVRRQVMWDCRCECGNEVVLCGTTLRNGGHVYCGKCPYRTLGFKSSVVRKAYLEMLKYLHEVYITPAWIESIIHFHNDIGPRPGLKYGIKRIDRTGPFVKENMHWVNNAPAPKCPRYLFMGTSLSAAQLADTLGISRQAMHQGLKRGWTMTRLERRFLKQQAQEQAQSNRRA